MKLSFGSTRRSNETEFFSETAPSRLPLRDDEFDLSCTKGDVWNIEEALQRVDADHAFLREMVELFLTHSEELLLKLKEGLAADDTEAVRKSAHALKGSAAELSAREMFNAARSLEETARIGDVSALGREGQRFDQATSRLYPMLRAWLSS